MGNWKGYYDGDFKGTINMYVNKQGYVNGQFNSEDLSGLILSDGSMLNTQSSSGFILQGNLKSKNGVWKKQNLTGTWHITKQ